jgi:hypothetical protein
MSSFEVLVIAPEVSIAPESDRAVYETPYGTVHAHPQQLGIWRVAWVAASASPFAAIYAVTAAGAASRGRAGAGGRAQPAAGARRPAAARRPDRPHRLARYTFFAGKGWLLRSASRSARRCARRAAGWRGGARRVFARVSGRRAGRRAGADLGRRHSGGGVVPVSVLARELERATPLCVVALTPSLPAAAGGRRG